MAVAGQYTFQEITSQPQVWTDVLDVLDGLADETARQWRALSPKQVLFTGCGSTHYLAQSAAALLQGLTGVPARGVPASEIVLFPNETLSRPEETLLVAISRSGTTTETAAALTRFRQLGGKSVWGITCYPQTPVGQETDFVMLAEAAQEQSVAQTRSFSSMLLLAQGLAAVAGNRDIAPLRRLPDVAADILAQTAETARALGENQALSRFFFLGSGPQYGIANEVMLKMKEMSITHSEAYHFMEFRHGPISMVDEHSLVAGLFSQRAAQFETAVATECAEMGGALFALSPSAVDAPATANVALPSDTPWWARPALYLPALQLMAYHRSISKGLNPDRPRNLEAVVVLDRDNLVAGGAS